MQYIPLIVGCVAATAVLILACVLLTKAVKEQKEKFIKMKIIYKDLKEGDDIYPILNKIGEPSSKEYLENNIILYTWNVTSGGYPGRYKDHKDTMKIYTLNGTIQKFSATFSIK